MAGAKQQRRRHKQESAPVSKDQLFELFDWLHKLYQFTPVSEGMTYSEVFDELERRLDLRVSESSGIELASVETLHRQFHEDNQDKFRESGE